MNGHQFAGEVVDVVLDAFDGLAGRSTAAVDVGALSLEQLPVGGCFFFYGERVGAGGGGHTVEAESAIRNDQLDAAADGRDGAGVEGGDDLGGFLAGGDEGVAVGDAAEEGGDVRRGDDLEEGVGGVVLEAADFTGGVIEGEAGVGAETAYGGFVEAFFAGDAEMVFVGEVDQAHDPPEVVDPVGVVEWHAPPVLLRRKTSEEYNPRILRQERFERVSFSGDGHHDLLCTKKHTMPELNKLSYLCYRREP